MFGRRSAGNSSGDRGPGESAMAWLERRAPNDPMGRLTIIVVGNGYQGTVLDQMRVLAMEFPETLERSLAEVSSRWPRETALAWSVAFPGQPRAW